MVSLLRGSVCEGVRITTRLHPAPRIMGDSSCLTQALYLLLERACMVSRERSIVVGTGYLLAQDRVFIYVRDSGGGTPRAHAHQMFGPAGEWGLRTMRAIIRAHRCGQTGAAPAFAAGCQHRRTATRTQPLIASICLMTPP